MSCELGSQGPSFLTLPREIRLSIYEELLAPCLGFERLLCKCQRCRQRTKRMQLANPMKEQRTMFPAVLATNKAIHDEAISILYSKNVFQLNCPEISIHATNTHVPDFNAFNSLIFLESAIARMHLKKVLVTFSCYARDELEGFPDIWSWVEPMILNQYPNLDHITVLLSRVNIPYRVLLVLARRHGDKSRKEHCAENVQKYLDSIRIRDFDANWEMRNLCNAILPAQGPGLFDGSSFAIRAIRWSDSRKSRKLEKLSRGVSLQ